MADLCPTCHQPRKTDGRTTQWRARIRLYSAANKDEPLADTDAESAADAPGAAIYAGLPAVAEDLGVLAAVFHGAECVGLDIHTLQHSLKSLRPTILRRGGNAVWRVQYSVQGRGCIARVDVERVTQ